jgi:hypothetical protein
MIAEISGGVNVLSPGVTDHCDQIGGWLVTALNNAGQEFYGVLGQFFGEGAGWAARMWRRVSRRIVQVVCHHFLCSLRLRSRRDLSPGRCFWLLNKSKFHSWSRPKPGWEQLAK